MKKLPQNFKPRKLTYVFADRHACPGLKREHENNEMVIERKREGERKRGEKARDRERRRQKEREEDVKMCRCEDAQMCR